MTDTIARESCDDTGILCRPEVIWDGLKRMERRVQRLERELAEERVERDTSSKVATRLNFLLAEMTYDRDKYRMLCTMREPVKAKLTEDGTMKITRQEFRKLAIEEQRKILEQQADKLAKSDLSNDQCTDADEGGLQYWKCKHYQELSASMDLALERDQWREVAERLSVCRALDVAGSHSAWVAFNKLKEASK